MNNKISIITASYNYQDYIKETIESVINQTYQNWEMIIVDDGSKDNSVEIIKSYCQKDSRIKLYQHKNGVNKGLIETLKLGISKADSEWIVFLESDDTITPNYLEKKLELIKNNNKIEFIFNKVKLFGNENAVKSFDFVLEAQEKIVKNRSFITVENFKNMNPVITFSCVMMKKSLLKNINYNSPVKQWLDYYMWLQISRKTNLYYISEELTNWRIHGDSYNNVSVKEWQDIIFKYTIDSAIHSSVFQQFILILGILKYFRRKIIRFSLKERKLVLFGKIIFQKSL